MEFRTSERSDLALVASWLDSSLACRLWSGSRVSFPVDVERLAENIQYSESEAWFAVWDGVVVGFGQCIPKPERRIHLARILVDPAHRARGFGKRLTLQLLERARESRAPRISLNVIRENERALRLYQSLGFVEA